jgi:hypothetical protein
VIKPYLSAVGQEKGGLSSTNRGRCIWRYILLPAIEPVEWKPLVCTLHSLLESDQYLLQNHDGIRRFMMVAVAAGQDCCSFKVFNLNV